MQGFPCNFASPRDVPGQLEPARDLALVCLTCPLCDRPRRLIAQLNRRVVVRKLLPHLGHPTEPPRPAPTRSREQFGPSLSCSFALRLAHSSPAARATE